MLENIKTLTGNTDEVLIQLLIDKTKKELESMGKTHDATWDNVIEDIVIVKLNRLNHEGTSHYEANGMSETFVKGYPGYINDQLSALGLPCIGKGRAKLL